MEGISKRDENDNDDDNGDDGFAMAPLRFYKSEKILGKLYRNVNENLIWENDIKARGKLEHPQGIWRLLLNHALGYFKTNGITVEYRPWVNEALKLRNWYASHFPLPPWPTPLILNRGSNAGPQVRNCHGRFHVAVLG